MKVFNKTCSLSWIMVKVALITQRNKSRKNNMKKHQEAISVGIKQQNRVISPHINSQNTRE